MNGGISRGWLVIVLACAAAAHVLAGESLEQTHCQGIDFLLGGKLLNVPRNRGTLHRQLSFALHPGNAYDAEA
jgi:hypothetical protein